MKWGIYSTFFLLSMVKFMVTPFGGPIAELHFMECYVACVSGGIISALLFYYSSGYFMNRAKEKRQNLLKKQIDQGLPITTKKVFTRTNKFIVRMKMSIGLVGISFWAPFFLSVPIGSIVAAKFYGDQRKTFPLIVLGMFINGFITTGLAYMMYS